MVPRIFSLLIGALVLALMVIPAIVSIADEPRLLTEIAQLRALSRKEAEQSLPVQIRGVITWHSLNKDGSFVIDDGRVGIAFDLFVAVQRGLVKGSGSSRRTDTIPARWWKSQASATRADIRRSCCL